MVNQAKVMDGKPKMPDQASGQKVRQQQKVRGGGDARMGRGEDGDGWEGGAGWDDVAQRRKLRSYLNKSQEKKRGTGTKILKICSENKICTFS